MGSIRTRSNRSVATSVYGSNDHDHHQKREAAEIEIMQRNFFNFNRYVLLVFFCIMFSLLEDIIIIPSVVEAMNEYDSVRFSIGIEINVKKLEMIEIIDKRAVPY